MPYALLHSSQHAKALLFGLRLSRTSESAPGTIFRPILAQNTGPPPPDPFVRHTCHRIVWNVLHVTEGSVIATQRSPCGAAGPLSSRERRITRVILRGRNQNTPPPGADRIVGSPVGRAVLNSVRATSSNPKRMTPVQALPGHGGREEERSPLRRVPQTRSRIGTTRSWVPNCPRNPQSCS